jgi:uncharacterized protein (DUF433 family)
VGDLERMVSEVDLKTALHMVAVCAVLDEARHSEETLFNRLAELFPEATEEQINEAVRYAL